MRSTGMKIAIVGAGVSGLVCAHMLHAEHELVLFEAAERPGGHAHTVRVETDTGAHDVDTGFIVFNDRNYPSFERLLGELSVPTQGSRMSFGVSDGADFEYNGASPNGIFANRCHLIQPTFQRMLADLVRFNREARELLHGDADPSLREWLAGQRYSRGFVERLIVPQAAAVWSADPAQMWSFPARFLIEFFDNHGMLGFRDRPRWRTVTGGSRSYVEALVQPWRERLRLSTPVTGIRREPGHVTVSARGEEPETFDAIVIATHSDQALALLEDPSERERELLGAIPYRRNEAVLHTDRSLLPRRRRAWASWNYHLDPVGAGAGGVGGADGERDMDDAGGVGGEAGCTVTYHMNRLQSLRADRELCVTLNRTAAIDPRQIICTIQYEHPVYTPAGVAAQARRREISAGSNRTHYCGAYWGWGFHEDGVKSALRVVSEIGARRVQPMSV
jgi:predicted NAD/FAD-binding protein